MKEVATGFWTLVTVSVSEFNNFIFVNFIYWGAPADLVELACLIYGADGISVLAFWVFLKVEDWGSISNEENGT